MARPVPWQLAATVALLALMIVLGTLQYRWLGDVTQAERDRMRAALQTRVSEFVRAFDEEVTRTWLAFQVPLRADVTDGRLAEALSDAYVRWQSTTAVPNVVTGAYLVEIDDENITSCRRLDVESRTLTAADLPATFAAWTRRAAAAASVPPKAGPLPIVRSAPIEPLTPSLVIPVPRLQLFEGGDRRVFSYLPGLGPARLILVTLDRERLRHDLLAPLATRYFNQGPGAEYAVTVMTRDDPSVPLFELPQGTRLSAADGDLSADLFAIRLDDLARQAAGKSVGFASHERFAMTIVRRNDQGGSGVTFGNANGGVWQVRVRGRAGSLDALVQRSRRRNLAVAFGVLLLLAASFTMVLVTAGRQQRLARQQIEFVASVSHELRTPLAVICSAGENLADGVVTGGDQVRRYGALIGTEGRRLADMVERVMTFAGLTSGRVARPHATVDIARVINEVIARVAAEARERGLAVHVSIPEKSLPSMRGDADALRSAIQNIVGNAIKYSPNGAAIHVDVEATGRWLRILVSDRGLGIDAADLPHVFKPFFRGRRAVDAQVRGSGIGLSIVRQVVEGHGGRVGLGSRPGGGTSVTVELPADREVDAVSQPSSASQTTA